MPARHTPGAKWEQAEPSCCYTKWDSSIIGGMFRDKEVLIAIGAFVAIEFAFVAVMVLLTGGH
jgi:hypothetical protein